MEVYEYQEAKKALLDGSTPVMAHETNSNGHWFRIIQMKIFRGKLKARPLNGPEGWFNIDKLEVRK